MADTTTIPTEHVQLTGIPDKAFQIDDQSPYKELMVFRSVGRQRTDSIDIEQLNARSLRARSSIVKVHAAAVKALLDAYQASAAGDDSTPIFTSIERPQRTSTHDADWAHIFSQLADNSKLKEGWNGYSAPAPNDIAIANAGDFLKVMQECGHLPIRVAPSAVGGIGITCRRHSRKVYVEFFNNALISGLFANDATQSMFTKKIDKTPEDFDDVISDIEEYLNG
ncbi:MAG: hypothetical protein RJS97_08755 [Parvibaculaceae bacterium]